jgi:integrase
MKSFNFTTNTIERLSAHSKNSAASNAEYTDTKCTGLKLQVGTTGRKYFYYRYTYRGIKNAIRLGEFGVMSVAQARTAVTEAKTKMMAGLDPKSERAKVNAMPTVLEFGENNYIPHAMQHKRSYRNDMAKLRDHIYPVIGNMLLNQVTIIEIQKLLNGLRPALANATVNRVGALLSVMFNLAIKWELLERNPCQHIKKLKEAGIRERFLSADEARRIIEAAQHDSNYYAGQAIQTLLLTGLRRNEVLTARREHLDVEKKCLFLPHTKNGRTRTVILNSAAFDVLNNIQRIENSPWIFPGRDPSKPLHNPLKSWGRILKAANVERCRLHDCRHSFASILVNAGASLYEVQHLLGHQSSVTTQRYSHLASNTLRNTSQIVSNLIAKV